MAIRMVETKYDDMDGSDLPEDTKPWRLRIQNKTYDLYLSEKNRKKAEEFIGNLTKGAVVVDGPKKPGIPARSKEELAKVRAWLREQGHEVSETGVVRKAWLKEYDDAH